MFTKFYDFSLFSFHLHIIFTLLLTTFLCLLISGVVGGQIRGLSLVKGGETLCSSCNLAKVYTRSRLNPLGILRQAATQTKPITIYLEPLFRLDGLWSR